MVVVECYPLAKLARSKVVVVLETVNESQFLVPLQDVFTGLIGCYSDVVGIDDVVS